ncbi:MAG: hypothetical protein OFPI_23490 [Osedax symbiont Rs2]|nr:MAG: hypothetical protein OFPI_23490 [Osedax symbiont Rs2]
MRKSLLLQKLAEIILLQGGQLIDQGNHHQLQYSNQYYQSATELLLN